MIFCKIEEIIVNVDPSFRHLKNDSHPYSFLKSRDWIVLIVENIDNLGVIKKTSADGLSMKKELMCHEYIRKRVIKEDQHEIVIEEGRYKLTYSVLDYISEYDNTRGGYRKLYKINSLVIQALGAGKNTDEINNIIEEYNNLCVL